MVLLCFKLFISLACSYQVTGQQSGLRGARTQRVAGFGTCPGLREWAKFSGFGDSERYLNDTRKAQKAGHRLLINQWALLHLQVLAGGLEPASKNMSWSLWGGAASTPFLPSCLPALLPSCLPAFLPSCLPAFLPSWLLPSSLAPFLLLLPCLPSSSALPPFLFLPSSSSLPLPPFLSSLPLPPFPSTLLFPLPHPSLLPYSLDSFIPSSHPSSLRPFSSCFLFLPVSLPLLSSSILSLSPFHPSLT